MTPIEFVWWTLAAVPAILVGLFTLYAIRSVLDPAETGEELLDEYEAAQAEVETAQTDWGAKLAAELKRRQNGEGA